VSSGYQKPLLSQGEVSGSVPLFQSYTIGKDRNLSLHSLGFSFLINSQKTADIGIDKLAERTVWKGVRRSHGFSERERFLGKVSFSLKAWTFSKKTC